jgi:hypothetical protein
MSTNPLTVEDLTEREREALADPAGAVAAWSSMYARTSCQAWASRSSTVIIMGHSSSG